MDDEEDYKRARKINSLWRTVGGSGNNMYLFLFMLSFSLNGVVLAIMWLFSDFLLHFKFKYYGLEVWNYYMRTQPEVNPMDFIFPKLTSCIYNAYGKSGTRESYNGQCLISLNILNEKIFLFLWMFYVFLTIALIIKLCHFTLYLVPSLRFSRILGYLKLSPKQTELLQKNLGPGDIFVLMRMKDNISPSTFNLFIQLLVKDFRVEQLGWKNEKEHGKILREKIDEEDGLLTGNRLIAQNAKEFGKASLAYIRNSSKSISRKNNGNYYRSDSGWAYQNGRHVGNGNARPENEYHSERGSENGSRENEYQDVMKYSNDHVQVDVEKN